MSESDFQDILHHLYRNNEKQVTESILDLTCQSNKSSLHNLDFGPFPALQNTIPNRISVHPLGSDVINFTNNYFNFPPELHFLTTVLEKVGSSSTFLMDSDESANTSTSNAEPTGPPTSDPEPVRELRQENFNIQTAIADMFKARGRNQGPVLNNTTFPNLPRDPFARPCDVEAATQQFFCSEWLYGDSPGIHPYDDTTNRDADGSDNNSDAGARSRSRPMARSRSNNANQREVVIHDDPLDLSHSNPYAECTYGQTRRSYRSRTASARTRSRSRKPKLRSRTRTRRKRPRNDEFEEDELDQVEVDQVLDDEDEISEDEGGECVLSKPSVPGMRSQRKTAVPHLRRKKKLVRPRTRSRFLLQKRRRASTKAKHRSRSRRFQPQQPRSLLDLDRGRYQDDEEEGPAVTFADEEYEEY